MKPTKENQQKDNVDSLHSPKKRPCVSNNYTTKAVATNDTMARLTYRREMPYCSPTSPHQPKMLHRSET